MFLIIHHLYQMKETINETRAVKLWHLYINPLISLSTETVNTHTLLIYPFLSDSVYLYHQLDYGPSCASRCKYLIPLHVHTPPRMEFQGNPMYTLST